MKRKGEEKRVEVRDTTGEMGEVEVVTNRREKERGRVEKGGRQ